MTYRPIPFEAVKPEHKKTFEHANMYLHDVYGIMRGLPPAGGDGGGGTFVAATALLSLLNAFSNFHLKGIVGVGRLADPLARSYAFEVMPCEICKEKLAKGMGEHGKNFHTFLWKQLAWAHDSGRLVTKCCGVYALWVHFRHPLIHAAAIDESSTKAQRGKRGEPIVGKWGEIPAADQSIERLEASCPGLPSWPALQDAKDEAGNDVHKLVIAPLYLITKDLIWRSALANS